MVALQEKEVQENEEFRGPQALLRVLNANLFGKLVFLKKQNLKYPTVALPKEITF